MKQKYIHPGMDVVNINPQQIICASGGWAEMGGYGTDTGGGFSQTEP